MLARCLLALLGSALTMSCPAAPVDGSQTTDIGGRWIIDERASDSVEEKFKHFRKPRRGGFRDGGIGAGKGGAMGGQHGEKAGDRDTTPRGSLRDMVAAKRLQISGREVVSIVYDESITRTLTPNPNGRVYSASGNELVVDRFGYTLSFWDGNALVVETTTRRGLDVVERYRIDRESGRLNIVISVTPSGEFGVEFLRVFERDEQGD